MGGWPWPLDGVQDFFEDLWNWISRAAVDAVSVVTGWVWDAIWWVKDRISEAFIWLEGVVKNVVGSIWKNITGAFSALSAAVSGFITNAVNVLGKTLAGLGESLSNALAGAAQAYYSFLAQIWQNISAGLNSVGQALGSALAGAKEAIVSGVTGLYSAISTHVGNAVNTLGTAFNGAMEIVGSWVSDALAGVAKALGEALGSFASWIFEKLQWIAQSIIGVAIAVKDAVVGFFDMIGRGFISLITTIFGPGSPAKEVQAEAETAFKTMFTELEQLTKIERKSEIPYEALLSAIVSTAARFLVLKIGVEAAGAAADAAHPTKELGTYKIAAGLMGILDMPRVIGPVLTEPIRQGIFIPWRQYWASRYTPEIPGSGDLIRFMVLEVIERVTFTRLMGLQGFSAIIADWYFEAHWRLPAYGQLIDAFHRGSISATERDKYIVWHDYKPEPRPGIAVSDQTIMGGLTKRLIPRVDLRRGYRIGRLSRAELDERYGWLGYEEDSELQTDIQVGLAFEAERNKLRDNAKADLVDGLITEAVLRADLATLDFSAEAIDYHVADAVADRERRHKKKLLDIYEDAYQKDLKTYDALETDAATVIVDPDALDLFLTEAWIRKFKKPKGD